MDISSSIFKAYDIRGIVEKELTPEVVKLIGLAIGSESIAQGERSVVCLLYTSDAADEL